MLAQYLEDLESRIDPEVEDFLLAQWRDFVDGKFSGAIFSPARLRKAPARIEWPHIYVNDTLDNMETMAVRQLSSCSGVLAEGGGALMNIRTDYGVGIVPTMFGAPPFVLEKDLNTLPGSRPLPGGTADIERIVAAGVPPLDAGLGRKVFETGGYFIDMMKDYPKVRKYVHIYHPDFQGPIDVCELLWGSPIFVDLYERPDLIKACLELVTETYSRLMREWNRIAPPYEDGIAVHWGLMHKGALMLRDDSAMNLSPETFEEFIRPYDQRLLDEFGGGCIHFCGRGSHFIHLLSDMPGVYAVHASQAECNDMETIFRHTVDKGIKLIWLNRKAAEEAIARGRSLHGCVHCW
jgi:hypothetical protein